MKYLRRNQDEPQPDLHESMADFKQARFGGNSKIGQGLTRLPEFRQASVLPSGNQQFPQMQQNGPTVADLGFLNMHGNESDFPLKGAASNLPTLSATKQQ